MSEKDIVLITDYSSKFQTKLVKNSENAIIMQG